MSFSGEKFDKKGDRNTPVLRVVSGWRCAQSPSRVAETTVSLGLGPCGCRCLRDSNHRRIG